LAKIDVSIQLSVYNSKNKDLAALIEEISTLYFSVES
jgi:hypothetical protein